MAERVPEHWVSRPATEVAINDDAVSEQLGFAPEQLFQGYEFLTGRIAEQYGFKWVNHAGINGFDGDTDHIMTNAVVDYDEVLFPTCADQECSRSVSIVSGCVVVSCDAESFDSQEGAEIRDAACDECHFDVAKTVVGLIRSRAAEVERLDEEKIAEQNRHQQVESHINARISDLLR